MAYRKKFAPTKDGFQEVWDSLQDPSIEQLIAGIQQKRYSREQLLEKIAFFRNSHSTVDIELNRLAVYGENYNDLWAAKNTYNFGTTEALQNRTRSQCMRWSEMLEMTSPRFRKSAVPLGQEQTVYKASYLTKKDSYELDMWGPASYGTLIYDLKEELDFIVSHMEDGEQLCKDVLEREANIDKDPEWKKQLFDKQYREEEERNSDTIERYIQEGFNYTNPPLYEKMLTYDDPSQFINENFHKPSTTQFVDFVVKDSTVKLMKRAISPIEKRLLGDDFEKITRVRLALSHIDELLTTKPNGQFNPQDIVQLIYWSDVLPSTKSRKDSEHEFYEKYIKPAYQGEHTWPVWSTVFSTRKTIGTDNRQRQLDKVSFNAKFLAICSKG